MLAKCSRKSGAELTHRDLDLTWAGWFDFSWASILCRIHSARWVVRFSACLASSHSVECWCARQCPPSSCASVASLQCRPTTPPRNSLLYYSIRARHQSPSAMDLTEAATYYSIVVTVAGIVYRLVDGR